MRVVLGVDAGASRTRARVGTATKTLAEAETTGANLYAVGETAARQAFRVLLEHLGPHPIAAACIGAAGSDSAAARRPWQSMLAGLLPGVPLLLVHDARLILAAAGQPHGIVVVAGTGSVAYGRTRGGRETRAGGWGHRLGDEGGGYWMVREAIRRMLVAADAGEPRGRLARALLAATECRTPLDLAHAFHAWPAPAAWARHAPLVLKAAVSGDQEALAIAEEAAASLAHLARRVAARLRERGPVVLAGGLLLHNAFLVGKVKRALLQQVGPRPVTVLSEPPVVGAVRLAEGLLKS